MVIEDAYCYNMGWYKNGYDGIIDYIPRDVLL